MIAYNRISNYFIGINWFILSLISSSINDIISKYIGYRLHSYEIAFFRFLFSAVTLLPFIVFFGKTSLYTSRIMIHFARGALLFFGIVSWTHGIKFVPVTTATVISFTIPLFTLALGIFFLKENIIWQRWVATFIGFIGIIVTLNPSTNNFNPEAAIFIAAAIAFASLDIINKRFIIKETMLSMMFYSTIIVAMLALPFALSHWITPTFNELKLLFVLGSSGNLILFFLLKSFAIVDATAVAPYRYLELILSAIMAYLLLDEIPHISTLYGAFIIIPVTLFIIYSEERSSKKRNENFELT